MRKFSALFILIVMFIPLAFAAMTLSSIRPWVLDRGFYEEIVGNERLYEALLTDELPNRFNRDMFTETEQLPVTALSNALRTVLTVEYLRAQSLHVVDKVFDYLEGRESDFEIALDITAIKQALTGDARVSFAEALAASLPACDPGQQSIAAGGSLTRCIAGDSSINAAAEQIATALPGVIENTPDQIVLNDDTPYIRMNWYDIDWPFASTVIVGLDIAILMTIVTALSVGIVGAFIGGDDLRGRLKWFSLSLFAPASLFLVVGLVVASPLIAGPLSRGLASARWGVQYSDSFRAAVSDVVIPVAQQVGSGILLTGVIGCLIALGVLILSWVTPASTQEKPRMVQVPMRNP